MKAGATASSDDGAGVQTDNSTLEPWQFFVLAALSCATALTFIVRGEGLTAVILLTVLMGATALVGLAALKAIRPLVTNAKRLLDLSYSVLGTRVTNQLMRWTFFGHFCAGEDSKGRLLRPSLTAFAASPH